MLNLLAVRDAVAALVHYRHTIFLDRLYPDYFAFLHHPLHSIENRESEQLGSQTLDSKMVLSACTLPNLKPPSRRQARCL